MLHAQSACCQVEKFEGRSSTRSSTETDGPCLAEESNLLRILSNTSLETFQYGDENTVGVLFMFALRDPMQKSEGCQERKGKVK